MHADPDRAEATSAGWPSLHAAKCSPSAVPAVNRSARMTPRHGFCAALVAFAAAVAWPAQAQVRIGIDLPGVDIGIRVPVFPRLARVPGYPVYYDPQGQANYFFYDGLYWVYRNDVWYESAWYDGPWRSVDREAVPVYVLRVPVRYYRQPPAYFRGWRGDAPPRWGDHWGPGWQQRHDGWDRWDRRGAPPAAPVPIYQQSFRGGRYPREPERQEAIRSDRYRFQPRDEATQPHWQRREQPPVEGRPADAAERPGRGRGPDERRGGGERRPDENRDGGDRRGGERREGERREGERR
jgi:hypothetical protein